MRISDEEFKNVLPHFRRSSEILRMRKRCRLEIERKQSVNENCEQEQRDLATIDAELVRRRLRKPNADG